MSKIIIEGFEGLVIAKGGYLKEQSWVPPEFDESDEIVTEGYYEMEDITDKLPMNLYVSCVLEQGVTLRDVFLLCNRHREFLSIIQRRNFFEDYIDYGLNAPKLENPEQGVPFGDSVERWQRMQIDRNVNLEHGYTCEEDVVLEFTVIGDDEQKSRLIHKKGDVEEETIEIYNCFHGFSFPLTQADIDGMDCPAHYKVNDEVPLGFFGYIIEKLMDIPLVIDSRVFFHESHKMGYNSGFDMRKIESNSHLNLGDIIEAIFYEISFYGSPEKSRAFDDELSESADEARGQLKNNE